MCAHHRRYTSQWAQQITVHISRTAWRSHLCALTTKVIPCNELIRLLYTYHALHVTIIFVRSPPTSYLAMSSSDYPDCLYDVFFSVCYCFCWSEVKKEFCFWWQFNSCYHVAKTDDNNTCKISWADPLSWILFVCNVYFHFSHLLWPTILVKKKLIL